MDRDGRATTVTAPHLTYGLVPWRKALFALLGVCAAGAILRRRHASGLAVAAQWGLAMMAVGVAVLAWRSGRGCDLVNWATSGGDYELASAGGRVSLIRVTDGAAARGLGGKSTPFAFGEGRQPWYVPMLAPTAEAGRWGVASSTGVVSGESKAYAYRRYEVSHGALVGLLMVVPVVVWVAGAGRRVRRWWRRRAGRCGACGYDVRSAGGRCSECGAVGLRVSARVSMSFGERTSTHAHVRDGELRANAS